MTASAIGIAILALLGFWLFGGLVLRVGGFLLILAGAVGLAAIGDGNATIPLAVGAFFWFAGKLHYAVRHRA